MRHKYKWTYWLSATLLSMIAVLWMFVDERLNFFAYIAPFAFGFLAVREIYWFFKDTKEGKNN